MSRIFLGLGTNLGDRTTNLRTAIAALAELVRLDCQSSLWETAPLYVTDQPAFLNMAVGGETDLAPLDLLRGLKRLEDELGRVASVRYGPRLIDLDILLYDHMVLEVPDLVIPHPRMGERRFALAPLAEITGDQIHPITAKTVTAMLAELPEVDDIRCLGKL